MKKQPIIQAWNRFNALKAERAELLQKFLTLKAELYDSGTYGQCSELDITRAEHAGMMLQFWEDECKAELETLRKEVEHFKQPMQILQQDV